MKVAACMLPTRILFHCFRISQRPSTLLKHCARDVAHCAEQTRATVPGPQLMLGHVVYKYFGLSPKALSSSLSPFPSPSSSLLSVRHLET